MIKNFEKTMNTFDQIPDSLAVPSRLVQHNEQIHSNQSNYRSRATIKDLISSTEAIMNEGIMKQTSGKILVIDDHFTNFQVIENFLKIIGFKNQLVYAYEGKEALRIIKETVDDNECSQFSLIMIECKMPIMDGYEALKQIN